MTCQTVPETCSRPSYLTAANDCLCVSDETLCRHAIAIATSLMKDVKLAAGRGRGKKGGPGMGKF